MADESVSMDAKINVNQDRVLTRDDELRLFALQTATKDVRFNIDKESAVAVQERVLADAKAYYAFLTDQESTRNG